MVAYSPLSPPLAPSLYRRPQVKLMIVIMVVSVLASLFLYAIESKYFQGAISVKYAGRKWDSEVSETNISENSYQFGILDKMGSLGRAAMDMIPFEFRLEPEPEAGSELPSRKNLITGEILPAVADLDINSVYDQLKFPDKNSGGYRRDLTNTPSTEQGKTWSKENKLNIYVVLHSHNDAGWGKTFEQYYSDQTFYILNNILHHLTQDEDLKFIWCETSFFSLWWKDLPAEKRSAVKKIIASKQLEFVAGGWVMPDEANVHYISYFTQLIEGHQYLKQHLNVTAKNGWAIDPFGLSSSLSFLLTRAGIHSTVFSRVHYVLREFLMKEKSTEFLWRQQWDQNGSSDVLSYLMPSGTYDYRSTCGENSACGFFQGRLFPDDQVEKKAMVMLEALRKKAKLFNTNHLFYPIGGDFRWNTNQEWRKDVKNLKTVMNYINSHEELNTEVKFATLDEYFTAVRKEINKGSYKPKTLIGDFFTYSDSKLDYWSGYYTSRAFHKATERQLMTSLRTAQLLFTMMAAEVSKQCGTLSFKLIQDLLPIIIQSRRDLSIFQHHDGITGTSRDYVVNDYAKKMKTAMLGCQSVSMQSLVVLGKLRGSCKNLTEEFLMSEKFYQPSVQDGEMRNPFQFQIPEYNEKSKNYTIVTVFNPLETPHTKLIKIIVSHPNFKVFHSGDYPVDSEIFPVFSLESNEGSDDVFTARPDMFELHFVAELRPLETRHFKVLAVPSIFPRLTKVNIQVFNTRFGYEKKLKEVFEINSHPMETSSSSSASITISNTIVSVRFNRNGTAEYISYENSTVKHPLKISFRHYKSNRGLYSFFPEGEAQTVEVKDPIIIVVQGSLKSYVEVWFQDVKLRHQVTLYRDGIDKFALDITNTIDIRKQMNYELLMHLATLIDSGDTFYTDSNGFQMMRRKRRDNLPIQGNYYPVASSTFIEDSSLRLTVLAAQPGGGSSLRSGEIEIMQDRIISGDDAHGIGQGGTDNLKTVANYKILFEIPKKEINPNPVPLLSLAAHHQLRNILHPVPVFVKLNTTSGPIDLIQYSPSVQGYLLPCDVGLALSHPLPQYKDSDVPKDTSIFVHPGEKVGLIFNRVGFDKRFSTDALINVCDCKSTNLGRLSIGSLFGDMYQSKLQRTGLSFIQEFEEVESSDEFLMKPMDVYSFTAKFKNLRADPWDTAMLLNVTS